MVRMNAFAGSVQLYERERAVELAAGRFFIDGLSPDEVDALLRALPKLKVPKELERQRSGLPPPEPARRPATTSLPAAGDLGRQIIQQGGHLALAPPPPTAGVPTAVQTGVPGVSAIAHVATDLSAESRAALEDVAHAAGAVLLKERAEQEERAKREASKKAAEEEERKKADDAYRSARAKRDAFEALSSEDMAAGYANGTAPPDPDAKPCFCGAVSYNERVHKGGYLADGRRHTHAGCKPVDEIRPARAPEKPKPVEGYPATMSPAPQERAATPLSASPPNPANLPPERHEPVVEDLLIGSDGDPPERVMQSKALKDFVVWAQDAKGLTTPEQITRELQRLAPRVPILKRMVNMADRVAYVVESLGA